jgi:hypothetical protein
MVNKVNSILGDVTNEIVEYVYLQIKKKTNKKRIKYIIDNITELIFSDLKPYLYTILAILILMFLMNCFNFYYYIKLFMKSNPRYNIGSDI